MTRGPTLPSRHTVIVLLAVLTVLMFVSTLTRTTAANVYSIQINAGVERFNGTLVVDPYYLDITVEASGIAGIDVTSPAGCTGAMTQVAPTTWWIEDSGYESLNEMRNDPCLGFGDFLLEFLGTSGETDSVTLAYDPGTSDPFTGFGSIDYPFHNETAVSLEPPYEWTCVGVCGADGWDLQVVDSLTGLWRYSGVLDPAVTQWDPGPLHPFTDYEFWNHSAQLLPGGGPAATDLGDPFDYNPTFETFNQVWFVTLDRIVLSLDRTQLDWTTLTGASAYDVVRGDLQSLRSSGGDFTTSTAECLAEDHPTTSLAHTAEPAGSGEGYWYLVRGVDLSGGMGYDSLVSAQSGSRDAEIDASASACN